MKKFKYVLVGLVAILGSIQAYAESNVIHVTVTVPTCYESSTDALAHALKMAKEEADAQCSKDATWFNPWLTDVQVQIGKQQNRICGGVTVDAEYSCTRP